MENKEILEYLKELKAKSKIAIKAMAIYECILKEIENGATVIFRYPDKTEKALEL